jgi:hypothetical protein
VLIHNNAHEIARLEPARRSKSPGDDVTHVYFGVKDFWWRLRIHPGFMLDSGILAGFTIQEEV